MSATKRPTLVPIVALQQSPSGNKCLLLIAAILAMSGWFALFWFGNEYCISIHHRERFHHSPKMIHGFQTTLPMKIKDGQEDFLQGMMDDALAYHTHDAGFQQLQKYAEMLEILNEFISDDAIEVLPTSSTGSEVKRDKRSMDYFKYFVNGGGPKDGFESDDVDRELNENNMEYLRDMNRIPGMMRFRVPPPPAYHEFNPGDERPILTPNQKCLVGGIVILLMGAFGTAMYLCKPEEEELEPITAASGKDDDGSEAGTDEAATNPDDEVDPAGGEGDSLVE